MGQIWAISPQNRSQPVSTPTTKPHRLHRPFHEAGVKGRILFGRHFHRRMPQQLGQGEDVAARHHKVGGVGRA